MAIPLRTDARVSNTIGVTKSALRLGRLIGSTTADVPVWRTIRNRLLSILLDSPNIRVGSHIRLDMSHPELGGKLRIGRDVEIGAQAILDISGGITIADGVTVSQGAIILSHDHTVSEAGTHWRDQEKVIRPISIGAGAWVGARSVILGKAQWLGSGAIVGAGSVVTKPVESNAVVAGNPAREVKRRAEPAG